MPLNSRDLWLFLKAQDQTNRALNTFSRNVRNAGNNVRMAQLEAAKANAMGMIAQQRLNNTLSQAEVGHLRTHKATLLNAAAQLRYTSVTKPVIDRLRQEASAIDANIIANQRNMNISNSIIAQQKVRLANINSEIDRVNAYNASLRDQEKNLAHLGARMQTVAQTATAMGFAMTAAGVATIIGLSNAIDVSVAYEKQVRLTATQIDNFSGNLVELGEIGRRVARAIAVPFTEIQPALFDIFSSMEVGLEDAEKLLINFSKAAVAGQVSIQDVSRATIGLLNAFQRPASDVNKLLDIQFQLIQEGIGTYEEWNQRIGLVTPSAVRAGQSIEMMMAALATATRMGMSAARSGTSVARAFDALSHPAAVKNMEQLGIKTRDANGRLLPFNQTLRQFREILLKMPEKDRVATILNVFKGAGGTIEARRFIQNILLGAGNLELFDNILKEMDKSAGSLDKAYGLMSDSVAAKTQLLKNQWMLLKEAIGKALIPVFSAVIGWLTNIMKQFDKLSPSTKRVIALILAGAAAFLTIAGPILLIVGFIAAFVAAFVVAGGAIVAVVGVLAGLTVALGVIAAAFVTAYKKSEAFRTLLGQVGQYFTILKNMAVDATKKIADAYKQHLQPALEWLYNMFNDKILPQLTKFANLVATKVLPKIKEAARIVTDIAGKAFEFIGWVLNHLVLPALEAMSNWWEENKKEIEPLIPVIAQAVKWFLIIAAVITGILVVALLGPLVGAVGAVIAIFAALIAIVVYVIKFVKMLWGWLKTLAGWIGDFFVMVWQGLVGVVKAAWDAIVGAVKTAWTAIVNFFSTAWDAVVGAFNAGMDLVKEAWTRFWQSDIGQLLIAIWELIVAIVRFGWAAIQYAFQTALNDIQAIWNYVWGQIKEAFVAIWHVIYDFAMMVWKGLVAVWMAIWPPVRDFFMAIWGGIRDFFVMVWQGLVGVVKFALNGIVNGLSTAWDIVVKAVRGAWTSFYNIIAEWVGKAKNAVSTAIDKIKDFFSGAGSWLFNAGREIVEGLIRGITSKINALTDKINELAKKITDRLPGSPVKAGPLKVLNRGYAGAQIVKMLAAGINANLSLLQTSMNTFGQTTLNTTPTYLREPSPAGPTEINQTINITTQEIDPRKHSAELGFQLVGTM